ncbi:MAG: hypothetical protein HY299_22725 [Verrucomicrobia bacterium]|nr:hypothetical protein [Verrucomicrobiota bacterium]
MKSPIRNVILLSLLLSTMARAVDPLTFIREPAFGSSPQIVHGFNLYLGGIHWWAGGGDCSVEFNSPSEIKLTGYRPLPNPRTIASDCHSHFQYVVQDDSYVFFIDNGRHYRKAQNASPADPAQLLPITTQPGSTLGAMMILNGRLYWTETAGGSISIWSNNPDGSDQQYFLSLSGSVVTKIAAFTYRDGIQFIDAICVLTGGGELFKWNYNPRASLVQRLAINVTDFSIHSRVVQGGSFFRVVTTIYATQGYHRLNPPPGRLLGIDALDASTTVLRTATSSDRQFDSVATDDSNIYITERFLSCGDLTGCSTGQGTVQRKAYTQPNWDVIVQEVAGPNPFGRVYGNEGLGLASDGDYLYFLRFDKIMYLRTDSPALQFDIQADGLEVVQDTQNINNSVPLVSNKRAIVRGYAHLRLNTTGKSTYFVNARLKVTGPFGESLGAIDSFQPAMLDSVQDWGTLRRDVKRSFLFAVPAEWIRYGSLLLNQMIFEMTVNPYGRDELGANPYDNNTISQSVVVRKSGFPCMVFYPVWNKDLPLYDPQTAANTVDFSRTISRAESMLPIEGFKIFYEAESISKDHDVVNRPCSFCAGSVETISEPFDFTVDNTGDVVSSLERLYNASSRKCDGKDEHYVGMVQPSAAGGPPGQGRQDGIGFWLKMSTGDPATQFSLPDSGRVLAHEFGHNVGLKHLPTTSGSCTFGAGVGTDLDPYKYDTCYIGATTESDVSTTFGFDLLSRSVIRPIGAADLMSYASSIFWTSDQTWTNFLGHFKGLSQSRALFTPALAGISDGSVLLVEGKIIPKNNSGYLKPFYHLPVGGFDPANLADAQQQSPGPYAIRQLDGAGNLLGSSGISPIELDTHDPDPGVPMPFVQLIPYFPGTRRVQLMNGGKVLIEQAVSRQAPTLTLLPPVLDPVNHSMALRWNASDGDNDPISFIVQYSPDDGVHWQALRAGYPWLSAVIDTQTLPGGTRARARVVASDGFNSTVATSAPFTLDRHAPRIVIGGASQDERLPYGTDRELVGLALDAEDGSLEGANLNWKLVGPVSRTAGGPAFSLHNLPPGQYSASLSGTDSDHQISIAVRRLEVLPFTVPDGDAPGLDGVCNDPGYSGAVRARVQLSNGNYADVCLLHADGFLYVCLTDLRFSNDGSVRTRVGLRIRPKANGSALPQADDLGFFVDEDGVPSQAAGNGSDMPFTLSPRSGFTAVINRGRAGWSAEFRIADTLVGGWNHAARLMFSHETAPAQNANGNWPDGAVKNQPLTWSTAYFGTLPPSANRRPIASAGASRTVTGFGTQSIGLDGTGSYDPDGNSLTYLWKQISGPSVALQNSTRATPYFIPSVEGQYQFRLTVNDGLLPSLTADTVVTVVSTIVRTDLPSIANPSIDSNGNFDAYIPVTGQGGDRFAVQASSNLIQWITIGSNTADIYPRVAIIDRDAKTYRHRFYRAVPLQSVTKIAYTNDFQGLVGNEWSLKTTDTTPVGARRFLGQFGAQTVRLRLSGLPVHTSISVNCDLFIIRSWDGNGTDFGPDMWQLSVAGGPTLLHTTFSNDPAVPQAYPGTIGASFPGNTSSAERASLGFVFRTISSNDSVYRLNYSFQHTGATVDLNFSGIGLQELADESWGLDNVGVSTTYDP